MKFIPILFSTVMVQSIIADLKNQTRRTQGLEEINKHPDVWVLDKRQADHFVLNNTNDLTIKYISPKAVEGDIFWVRETWQESECFDYHIKNEFVYRANKAHAEFANEHNVRWKPSIFMPKEACRLFLEVTDVRLERLQDISEDDALSEGVRFDIGSGYFFCGDNNMAQSATKCFTQLWFQINGVASWNANPWVWVYTFKRINKPSTFNQ